MEGPRLARRMLGRSSASATTTGPEYLAAGTTVGLMLLDILLGNAYLLVGITGEKQLRVTEQVVAAISPQTRIDGKIWRLARQTN